jgi:hypothetical protein
MNPSNAYNLTDRPVTDYINKNQIYFRGIPIIPYKTSVYLGSCRMNILGITKEGYLCCLPFLSFFNSTFDSKGYSYYKSLIRFNHRYYLKRFFDDVILPLVINEEINFNDHAFLLSEEQAKEVDWPHVYTYLEPIWLRTRQPDGNIAVLFPNTVGAEILYANPSEKKFGCKPVYIIRLSDKASIFDRTNRCLLRRGPPDGRRQQGLELQPLDL